MAYYKVYDREKAVQSPVFSFWFRRYAPFDKFGAGGFDFEGDHRKDPSTSISATSRTYACLFVNRTGVLYGFSGSSGTRFVGYADWTGGLLGLRILMDKLNEDTKGVTAHADVSLHVKEQNAPNYVSFTASTAGNNPLVPASPNIDTFVTTKIFFNHSKTIHIEGEAFGDSFPNLEVFLLSGQRSAMLVDFRTTGSQDAGAMTRLWGSGSSNSLGKFSLILPLSDNGELAIDR
jgi:hypothetical protein